MNEYIEENKRAIILLTIGLFLLAIVLYFFLLRPQLVDLSEKKENLDAMEEELRVLEEQIAAFDEDELDVEVEQLLQEKKIPTERKLDEYILSLQRLESVTNSKIERIEFVYDSNLEIDEKENEEAEPSDNTEESAEKTEENLESNELEETDDENEGEETEDEINVNPEILSEKPEQLEVMTVRLVAVAPNFEEFIELLKVIENEERISIVTNLRFNKPTEEDTFILDEPLDMIPFEAELTTFYYAE